MSKRINLYIETNQGRLVIPFRGIREVDSFTVEFNNRLEFLPILFRILNVPVSVNDVNMMYLSYKNSEELHCFDYDVCLPLKYGKDNYNIDSVVENFAAYLKQDFKRLDADGVRNVGMNIVHDFNSKCVKNYEIDLIAKAYLKDDYRKIRDTYFMICDDFDIRIDKIVSKENYSLRKDLFQLESCNDDYIQYLIELASRGGDEYDRAMEELSKIDVEDIGKSISKNYYGVIDSLGDESLVSPVVSQNFEQVIDINIDVLQEMCRLSLSSGRKR